MESFEGIWDFEIEKIDADIMDLKEKNRINKIIADLKMYENDADKITDIFTDILEDKNVIRVLTKVSQSIEFYKHFPEFYDINENGESVINCQQNSKYHKYGVFRHTLEAIKNVGTFSKVPYSDYELRILKWTMLLHDIGKPFVKTTNEEGNDSFTGHEDVSFDMSHAILDRFKFSKDEKETILKLIKYHDKFINQGDITYDNMKLLVNEFQNNKKTFNLLLEVKEADAKAKCDEVYNTFKQVKQKYQEFLASYYSTDNAELGDIIENSVDANVSSVTQNTEMDTPTSEEFDDIILNIINRRNIEVYYQPMIDIEKKKVAAYEMFSRIEMPKNVSILDVLNYSKGVSRFDKVQQVLMVNALSEFETISNKESDYVFVNIDFDSYNKYINKPRLYDMMQRNKIVIEFKNYINYLNTDLEMTIKTIRQHGGFVSLDSFGVGALRLENLDTLKPNFIKFDVSFLSNINVDSEKQKYIISVVNYCMSKDIDIVAVGVEDRGTLITLKNLGLRYLQGYYLGYPDKSISLKNQEIGKLIDSVNNENSL